MGDRDNKSEERWLEDCKGEIFYGQIEGKIQRS